MRKGQISVEYVLVMGFVFMAIIPLIIVFYQKSADFNDDITFSQIDKVSTEIVNAANEVYYQGRPSKKTIRVYFPEQITSVNLNGKSIEFYMDPGTGQDVVVYKDSVVNLTGAISKGNGLHILTIQAEDGYVTITE